MIDKRNVLQIYLEQNYNTDPHLLAGVIHFVYENYLTEDERVYALSEMLDWIGVSQEEVESIIKKEKK